MADVVAGKGEIQRQRIVDAADNLFYQQGYESTSFKDISTAVGMSRGNFYYHFKSKDEILHAVIDARVSHFQKILNEWDEKITDPRQRLYFYIDMQLRNQENIVSHGCPIGSLCTELSKIDHAMLSDANQIFVIFNDWLVVQFKLLGVKKNTKQLAMSLLARGQGIATVASAFEDNAFLKKEVKELKRWLDDEVLKVS